MREARLCAHGDSQRYCRSHTTTYKRVQPQRTAAIRLNPMRNLVCAAAGHARKHLTPAQIQPTCPAPPAGHCREYCRNPRPRACRAARPPILDRHRAQDVSACKLLKIGSLFSKRPMPECQPSPPTPRIYYIAPRLRDSPKLGTYRQQSIPRPNTLCSRLFRLTFAYNAPQSRLLAFWEVGEYMDDFPHHIRCLGTGPSD